MQGILRCARYAYAPNKLRYCGPDKNFQLFSYLAEGVEDQGLNDILTEFAVMYPYLKLIASENGIADPFSEQVVEAYWIGNRLLEGTSIAKFYDHLLQAQGLKDRFQPKDLKWIVNKVPAGARVHHSFHVFNVWHRTGHQARPQTVLTMDNCRISWGEVLKVDSGKLVVKTQKLRYLGGKLGLETGVRGEVSWRLGERDLVRGLKIGDLVTSHWGWVCEKISQEQGQNLEKYTRWHLELANTTI